MEASEVIRLLTDWRGNCRTCHFWGGDRQKAVACGQCQHPSKVLEET